MPVEFQRVENRFQIWISLKTGSRRLACGKAPAVWNLQAAARKAWFSGHDDDAAKHFEFLQDLAACKYARYTPLDRLEHLPIGALLDWIKTIANRNHRSDPMQAAVALGAQEPPELAVSQVLETLPGQ